MANFICGPGGNLGLLYCTYDLQSNTLRPLGRSSGLHPFSRNRAPSIFPQHNAPITCMIHTEEIGQRSQPTTTAVEFEAFGQKVLDNVFPTPVAPLPALKCTLFFCCLWGVQYDTTE